MAHDAQQIRFLGYRLDPVARTLTGPDGSDVALHGRAFDVLSYLIAHRPRVVGKDELLAAVWPDRVVEENNLGQAISALRRLLGTGAGDRHFIRTVPGRGYSFVAEIEEATPETGEESTVVGEHPVRRRWWHLPAIGASVLLLALAVAWAWREHGATVAPHPASATVAVLPFRSLDPGPRDELLELGVAEIAIARLSRATRLRVLSLSAVQAMAGKAMDPVRAGTLLGADYVVEGHFQRSGDTVRVSARLLAMPEGHALWAETFDRDPRRVFELQDAIAARVAASLSQAYRLPAPTSGCHGDDPVAYRAYLRGYKLISRPAPDTVDAADAAFRSALARDPLCARALAGISQAARLRVMVSDGDPEVEFPRAEAAVASALKIDPESAEAYSEQGALQFWYRWDWTASEASLQRAIALDPNLVNAHITLAHLYANLGRDDRAASEARIAVALDPLSPIVNSLAAAFIDSAGQQREAQVHLRAALELEPDFWVALMSRGMHALFDGHPEAAERDIRTAVARSGRSTRSLVYLAHYYAASGQTGRVRKVLEELQARRAKGRYVLPSALAQVHVALGERRQALDRLEEGYRHSDLGMAFLDIWFGSLAGEPRFTTLVRAMRLPPPSGITGPRDEAARE